VVTARDLRRAPSEAGQELDYLEPNLFFWVPEDASEAVRAKLLEQAPNDAFVNLNQAKNGGWEPVLPERGAVRLMVFGPVRDIPTFHAMYQEGSLTFMVRDRVSHLHLANPGKSCNKVRFWRPKRYKKGIYLPDSVARKLRDKGVIDEPHEWDDPSEAMILDQEAAEPKAPEPDRGERVRQVVPFKEDQ
jgi:hypothetical protein